MTACGFPATPCTCEQDPDEPEPTLAEAVRAMHDAGFYFTPDESGRGFYFNATSRAFRTPRGALAVPGRAFDVILARGDELARSLQAERRLDRGYLTKGTA